MVHGTLAGVPVGSSVGKGSFFDIERADANLSPGAGWVVRVGVGGQRRVGVRCRGLRRKNVWTQKAAPFDPAHLRVGGWCWSAGA